MQAMEAGDEPTAAIRRVPFVYALIAVFAAAIAMFTVALDGSFDWWLVALGVVAMAGLVLPVPQWLSRWAPMVLVGVIFLALGGVSQRQSAHAASTLPIDVDRILTGVVVPVWLQQHLPALLSAPAAVLTGEYMLHYAAPLLTALWLWRRHRHRFDGFVATYTLAMVCGFAVYLAFPQTPPWYASEHGLLPPLHRTIVDVLQSLHVGGLYAGADPEPFGAMPSLHVTIPVLVAAALISAQTARWRWLWVLYPLTVGFGVLLMAEHYVVDTAAGVVVGLVAVAVVRALPARLVGGAEPDRHVVAALCDPEAA
jgi:hypothetical protein